jgi:PRD1 phage membrane DNA delivery
MKPVGAILVGLIIIAILAVVLSGKSNTATVIKSVFSGFATDIQAAIKPVTG